MKSIKDFKEVEFKYDANGILLDDFLSLMSKIQKGVSNQKSLRYKEASSADIYYRNPEDKLVRLRNSSTPVLTIKRKTTTKNNNHRIEVNLPLDSSLFGDEKFEKELEAFCYLLDVDVSQMRPVAEKMSKAHQESRDFQFILDDFLSSLNYQENFKIYKICEIFWMEDINFVYYKVLDRNMKGLDNFIEIEYDEDKALTMSAEACLDILKKWEKKLLPLGIDPSSRLTYSLYDKYKQPFNR